MKNILLSSSFLLTAFISAETNNKSSQPSIPKPTNSESVTLEDKPKPKRKVRVKSSFKGTDPMMAPDGQSQLPPTDGSRPKSK